MFVFTLILIFLITIIFFVFIFKLNRIACLIITATLFSVIIFFFTHYKVFIPLDINATGKNENYKIDLVYLWCEDNPQREKLRNELKEKFGILENKNTNNPDSLTKSRFVSNDELKYSLRSVEKYASWINKIYIITDNQVPKWLNLKHPKIKIVDHKEIMPESARPSFNSNAIEHCISNIKDLNEHFLYANDDMMFGNYVKPEDFFKNGKPIYILEQRVKMDRKSTYTQAIINGYRLFKKQFSNHRDVILDELLLRYPHHNIDPYLKSSVKKTQEVFKNEIDTCINSLFRSNTDIERIIYTFYALANNEAYYKIKKSNNIFNIKSIITKKNKQPISYYTNVHKGVRKKNNLIKKLNKYKMFCINDNELTTEKDRKVYKNIMERIFPDKSSFEK